MSTCMLYCCSVHGCSYAGPNHIHEGVRCPEGDKLIHERDKEFAISRIKQSMDTHRSWLEHFNTCNVPGCEEWAKDTVGDSYHHKQVLREYQFILDYLETT